MNSRNKGMALLTCFLLIVLAGCEPVKSVHALWTEDTLVSEPALVGTWVFRDRPDSSDLTLRFTPSGDKAYRMSLLTRKPDRDTKWAKGWSLEFDARLVRLGDTLFLDLYPDYVAQKQKKLIELDGSIFLQRVHTFYSVSIESDRLTLAYLDDSWVNRMIEQNTLSTGPKSGDFLLTAGTRELQQLLIEHAHNPEAFGSIDAFIREK